MTSPHEISPRIRTLDGWRGLAILLVLIDHSARYGPYKDQFWAGLGSFGVDIFFVLSGYIITARLLDERDRTSTISLAYFYRRRGFRILPLVAIYLASVGLLSLFVNIVDFGEAQVFGSLLFFRNYQIAAHPGGIYTAHFWSLSIEEHFYFLWPALLLRFGNRRSLWIALSGALASGLWRTYDSVHPTHFLPGAIPALRSLRTDARLDGLLLGSALSILFSCTSAQRFVFRWFPKETPLIIATFVVLNLQRTHNLPSLSTYLLITLAVCSTLVVKEGLAHHWLNSRPLVWIGTVSYSLYVWQQLFLLRPSDGIPPLGNFNVFPINITCVFAVATCSHYFIEKPAIAFGKRLLGRERKSSFAAN